VVIYHLIEGEHSMTVVEDIFNKSEEGNTKKKKKTLQLATLTALPIRKSDQHIFNIYVYKRKHTN